MSFQYLFSIWTKTMSFLLFHSTEKKYVFIVVLKNCCDSLAIRLCCGYWWHHLLHGFFKVCMILVIIFLDLHFYFWLVCIYFLVNSMMCQKRMTFRWLLNFNLFWYFRSCTAFERAKTDVFRIRTHNVGSLKKIRFVRHEIFFNTLNHFFLTRNM